MNINKFRKFSLFLLQGRWFQWG